MLISSFSEIYCRFVIWLRLPDTWMWLLSFQSWIRTLFGLQGEVNLYMNDILLLRIRMILCSEQVTFCYGSEFQDIFNVDHFIRSLRDEVRILKKLPPKLNKRVVYSLPPVSWSNISYYLHQVKKHLAHQLLSSLWRFLLMSYGTDF